MNLTKYIDTDLLLVIAASSFVCACSCLLIRAYKGKKRSRGKGKELQRPFIKGKRHLSPTTWPLFGNLQLLKGSPNQQEYILPKKLSAIKVARKTPSPGNLNGKRNLLENNTSQCHFLGDIITCINQQQWRESPAARMSSSKKVSSRKRRQLRATYTCHAGSLSSERGDILSEGDVQISVGIDQGDNDSNTQRTNGLSEMMALDCPGSPSSYRSGQHKHSSKCDASRRAGQISTVVLTPEEKSRLFRVRWHQPRTLLQANASAFSDSEISIERQNSLWAHKCSCNNSLKDMAEKLGHTFHRIPDTKEILVKSSGKQAHGKNPSYCNYNGPKCEGSLQLGTVTMTATSKGDTPNGCIDSDINCIAKNVLHTSKDVSKECLDISQHVELTRTSGSVAKAEVCPHEVSNSASVVKSTSKNEVSCMSCGMTLSKPQCFYSLGSLCTDEEICETDSDDINRHPVGDINVNIVSPLMDIQSHNNDTGYTSTDEFENELASDCFYEKADTGSYDGDYESDNEETVNKSIVVSDELVVKPLVSIGEPITITEYALREWKSNTITSVAMRKGYAAISSFVNCHHLRQIRGDNYCSIRAVLFQALVGGLPILNKFEIGKKRKINQIPSKLLTLRDTTLEVWRFADRFPVSQAEVKTTLENFVTFFSDQIHRVLECGSDAERLDSTLSLFSEDTQEFKVLEATKLLMYDAAVELFGRFTRGDDVPVFATLLFARDSSDTPCKFLTNHLNKTGDSGGLEQVEMCLLGYTLGLVIQVFRPSQVDKGDFIAYFPSLDDVPKYTPTVTLVAEDDRHYNIIL